MPAQRVKTGIVWSAPEAGMRCAIRLKAIIAKRLPSKPHVNNEDLISPWAVEAEVLCFDIPENQHNMSSKCNHCFCSHECWLCCGMMIAAEPHHLAGECKLCPGRGLLHLT